MFIIILVILNRTVAFFWCQKAWIWIRTLIYWDLRLIRTHKHMRKDTYIYEFSMPSYIGQLLAMVLRTSRVMKVTRQQVVETVDKHLCSYMDNMFIKYYIFLRISLSDKWKNVRDKELRWIWLLWNSFGNYIHTSDRSFYHKLQFSHRGSTSWNMNYKVDHICIPSLFPYHITFTVCFICMQLLISHPWP